MERLLQSFDAPLHARTGDIYDVQVFGRSRPGDTWQAWLVFRRRRDLETFTTGSETTQPSEAAVLYWATGLSATYLEGALARAQRQLSQPAMSVSHTQLDQLTGLEHAILRSFRRRATTQLATDDLFRDLPYAHADVMRALREMQNRRRLLLRRTEAGRDWLILTDYGVYAIDVIGRSPNDPPLPDKIDAAV